ncbi:hypothetical protein LX36DRAFT_655865 [Colletotrichum falcatum]|nr:hypothetical protein LX36DRAFT_655865 [Colletotrichum falcatum]
MVRVSESAASNDDNGEKPHKKRIYSVSDLKGLGVMRSNHIPQACQSCQARKRRCDGGEPVCGLCSRLDVACVYTQRRKRGPGRKSEPDTCRYRSVRH